MSEPWFLDERAEHLAIMMLTRHPEIEVARSPYDYGLDLLVTVSGPKHPGRIFGVALKASIDIARLVAKDGIVRSTLESQVTGQLSDYSFPVALSYSTCAPTQDILPGFYRRTGLVLQVRT